MNIRSAIPADTAQMHALEQRADTAAHWAEREYGALFAAEAPRRIALVAEHDGVVVGFLIARADTDEWEIENVVVAEERRRNGVGSALIEELLRQAATAKAAAVFLEVRESNIAARRLYEAVQFEQVGRRRGYYAHPAEDALLLKFSGIFG